MDARKSYSLQSIRLFITMSMTVTTAIVFDELDNFLHVATVCAIWEETRRLLRG